MNLLYLHYFSLVAKTENIAKAAARAYISPSGLSKVIGRLESEVGYALFIRSSNRLVLNEAGRVFYRFAEEVLRQQDDCLSEIKRLSDASEEIVSIALPADRLVTGIVERFVADYPSVRFSQYIMRASECQQALENREIDFAICHKPISAPGIIWEELARNELSLAVSYAHPMSIAGVDEADLIDFKDELILLHATASDERDQIIEYCTEAGFSPRIYQADPFNSFEMVARGLGVAFVQDFFFQRERDQLATGQYMNGRDIAHRIAVHSPHCVLEVGVARVEGRRLSHAAQELYDRICVHYGRV